MSSNFTPCSTCHVDRLASTLSEHGQCPFCIDEGIALPIPEPKYSTVTVVPSKNAGPRAKPDAPTIPRAARAEDQPTVDEAYALPYTAPSFDLKGAQADPAKELAMRALCRRRLLPFVQRFRPKYLAGWVHEDICRRLERFVKAIEAGESPRLLLLLPPRSGKSELGSRNFPPWVLGQHPDWEVIAVSHTQSLTLSFSRYVRDLVRDPAYKAIFPDLTLDPASQSIENWNTLQGGGYMAAGVGTGISGRGAHCLPLTERIITKDGAKSLKELLNDSESVHYVLSYAFGKLEYRRINGFITREAESFYRVTLADGTTFEATGEHPVCVDLGEGSTPSFRRMDDLRRGESLVTFGRNASNTPAQTFDEVPGLPNIFLEESVQSACSTEGLRDADSHVQPLMHGGDAQRDNDLGQGVSHLWKNFHHCKIGTWSTAKARGFISFLLKRVLRNSSFKNLRWGKTSQLQPSQSDLHSLFEGVSQVSRECEVVQDTPPILQQGMLQELVGWSCYPAGYRSGWATVLPPRVQGNAKEVVGGGSDLCCVHVPRKGLASQGQRHREQLAREPGCSLQTVSQTSPHGATTSRIESIEKVVGKVIVGDIEVDEAHNFVLASGNLLLNCLICDDLVKDSEASASVTIRENTWEWYISTAYTRLAPGGGVLGILTHWHEDDWAGRIQEVMKSGEGDVFEVVKYPAINEEGDEYILPDDTIQQFAPESDPPPEGSRLTRLRGTAIHPARYTTAMMLKIKNNLISSGLKRVWNALYQQNPVPDDGAYFTKEMLRWYTHPPRREDMFVYQAWDFAITEKTDSDWTVCCTIGQDEADNLYVLHILRFRSGDGNAIVDDILDQVELFKPDLIGFEDGQIWKSLSSQFTKRCEERRLYPSFETLQPLTDKKVRASPLKGRMQNGKLFIRQHQPWTEPFRQELMKFPSGKYDDQVDAAAWAVRLTLTKSAPKKRVPPAQKSWRDNLKALLGERGATHMSA